MIRGFRRAVLGALGVLLLGYAAIAITIWLHALDLLGHPPQRAADAALILGNRAYRDGKPNPCLTGRVDTGIALAREGRVRQLVLSGGIDREDGRVEAEVMQQHARDAGYTGTLLLEPVSSTTRENLSMSRAVLQAAGVKSVIIVSEPYHLWRVERLARAAGFDRMFELQYAAAPTSCWRRWGMLFKGALREPLAIVNNASNGYLH
ncbi:YdcF family protein [Variovorax sp. LjRoot290]|uniref:YdcF family protein n=1 Tax=unclassified Variovorax TaxID=663243 RepID=UPI003ECC7D39